jgi:hypothetical protein
MRIGNRNTCATYRRDSNAEVPGNGPPQISTARFAPTNGTDIRTEYPIARPIPERRSSTSE